MENNRSRVEKAAIALLSMQRHSWEQGVAMQAFLERGDMETVIAMAKEAVYRSMPDGRAATIGVTDAITDPCATGEGLLAACSLTKDPYLEGGKEKLLNWALHLAPRSREGVLYHLVTSNQFWVDSMYMLPPFLAVAGHYKEALINLYGYWEALYDKEKHLMCHMWDDEGKRFIRDAHWGTGNGWALAALSRMIRLLPADKFQADIRKIQSMAVELLDNVLLYMRKDGLFHDVIDDNTTFIETNTSQMTAYTIYEGIRQGWLPKSYAEQAHKLREAANGLVDNYGFVHGVCGAPNFDKPGLSPEGQAFYLLMENAYVKYEEAKQ
ncbi:MAG: glucosyl hydrolase family protein [Herbinix sp.]|jgi:rhamnogalacturonyl hydrolase YesR|nr:glucosyl hydrolase family protein [Herbinix sp.]